ncbi:endonuclease domain-containing protein [Actinoplanes sp. NPDC000266]
MTTTYPLDGVPADRVVEVRGAHAGDLAHALAGHSTDLAAVVTRPGAGWSTPREFVGAMLDDLERVAAELLPAWLPDASDITRADLGGTAAIRIMAAARASRAHYSRSFLTDLALLAVTGHRDGGHDVPVRARVTQLARLVAEAFGRTRCVLLVPVPPDATPGQRAAIVAGGEWLTHNAKVGVWLLGRPGLDAGRVPVATVDGLPSGRSAPIGKPHPASAVESALEAALAGESWAAGRHWNHTYRSTPLSPPIRLDLVWPGERCVVELDGPEHCHPVRFEADRRRDVQLQLDGYAVLRFTNARVVHDVGAVVHQIGTYLQGRRRETVEGP